MIAFGAPVPGFQTGELEPHGELVSVKKANGKYLCVTPTGTLEERESGGGPWELFRKGRAALIAERGDKSYVLPYVE